MNDHSYIFTPRKTPYSLKGLVSSGTLDEDGAQILTDALTNERCIMVVGTTGTGRTTLLNALLSGMGKPFVLTTFDGDHPAVVHGFVALRDQFDNNAGAPVFVDGIQGSPDAAQQCADLVKSTTLKGFTWHGRSSGSALKHLTQVVASQENDALALIAEKVDVIVTMGHRNVTVSGRTVTRHVITKIEALEGVGDDDRYVLTSLYEVKQGDSSVSWETTQTQGVEASWEIVGSLVASLRILHSASLNDGLSVSVRKLLTELAAYGGVEGGLAQHLVDVQDSRIARAQLRRVSEGRSELSWNQIAYQKDLWILAPLWEVLNQGPTLNHVRSDAIRILERSHAQSGMRPDTKTFAQTLADIEHLAEERSRVEQQKFLVSAELKTSA